MLHIYHRYARISFNMEMPLIEHLNIVASMLKTEGLVKWQVMFMNPIIWKYNGCTSLCLYTPNDQGRIDTGNYDCIPDVLQITMTICVFT